MNMYKENEIVKFHFIISAETVRNIVNFLFRSNFLLKLLLFICWIPDNNLCMYFSQHLEKIF